MVKKLILAFLLLLAFSTPSYAYESDYRVLKLENIFRKYNSPLYPYARIFVREADRNNLDWWLVASISGVESSFGKQIPYNSYNAYGWDNGTWKFSNWESSISIVSRVLAKSYIAKGAVTIEQIAPIYNPVTPAAWGIHVRYFQKVIENMPPNIKEISKIELDI